VAPACCCESADEPYLPDALATGVDEASMLETLPDDSKGLDEAAAAFEDWDVIPEKLKVIDHSPGGPIYKGVPVVSPLPADTEQSAPEARLSQSSIDRKPTAEDLKLLDPTRADESERDRNLLPIVEVDTPRTSTKWPHKPLLGEEFQLVLQRSDPSSRVGVSMFNQRGEDFIRIRDIRQDGLLHQWNHINPTKAVLPGDAILEVNGVTGADLMRCVLADLQHETLRLRMQRCNVEPPASSGDVH